MNQDKENEMRRTIMTIVITRQLRNSSHSSLPVAPLVAATGSSVGRLLNLGICLTRIHEHGRIFPAAVCLLYEHTITLSARNIDRIGSDGFSVLFDRVIYIIHSCPRCRMRAVLL